MKKALILLVAGTALCTWMMAQTTNDNAKNVFAQVLAATNTISNDAAASEALLPETALVEVAGANLDLMMAAVNSPPNCDIDLATTVKNAKVQMATITAANTGNVNTGPPAAAIVQVVNASPPQVVMALATSCQPPNLGVAFLELRAALHQGGSSQGSVSARANLVT
jgi:hypothetical protein